MKLTDEKIITIAHSTSKEFYWSVHDDTDLIDFARAILKEAGVEELERDAERLDFIEQNKTDRPLLFRKGRWSFAKYSNYPVDSYPTLRKAIDAELDQ